MENKHRPKRAAGHLASDSARETDSGDSKLAEPAKAGNSFERHVQGILNCFAPHQVWMLDNIELSDIECPKCRRILIKGDVKARPLTFHACKCVMIVHLMPGASIPRHAADWAAHLLAQAADYAKEEAAHECN
jgi:hypothetical protein